MLNTLVVESAYPKLNSTDELTYVNLAPMFLPQPFFALAIIMVCITGLRHKYIDVIVRSSYHQELYYSVIQYPILQLV